ncbi:hypothetical protein BGW80DRAFT_1475052 [Lactifluus volemus]|nr:hypothetical protein BGW80DRAFT_1475052 [Lactifluus volemus]
MFFIKELTHTIMLHPSYFGPRMQQYLESKLYSDVEGTCSGQFGFIIAVVSISDIGTGMGEVVDGVVHNVTRMGIFAEVGPLNCFVSQQLLHPDLKFDPSSNPPSYTSQDQVIENNTKIRIKIIGTRVDATEIFAIGTIKEDHLGVIE